MATATLDQRIDRLSTVSTKRVIEPDEAVTGDFGAGQIVPDELLLTAGLDLDLDGPTKVRLAREQTAALTEGGVRLEAILLTGFGTMISNADDLTDPRITYLLHELGEETRHSRLFIRMLSQLEATATNPFRRTIPIIVTKRIFKLITNSPLLLCTMVLAGEEIPDLLQKRQAEHPDTNDYVRRICQYHRQEEARHLAFARMLLPELWAKASRRERAKVKRLVPWLIDLMLNTQLFHPGIYEAVGLPPTKTWKAVKRSAPQVQMRHEATRPLLEALLVAAPELEGHLPRGWRTMCGVDRSGRPVAA